MPWAERGRGHAPGAGPSTGGMGLCPPGPEAAATPLIVPQGSPARGWPADKRGVRPTDHPWKEAAGRVGAAVPWR